ncbi:MAG TPA: polynucleotide adenylyltransferase PcnB [Planctomycetota bacterium]|nr:polynucleotide adenylyltransferase PcnB [Planctomycetota bacterium]
MPNADESAESRCERRSHSARRIPEEALDQDALRVVSRLARAGFEAYLVGGCVRDLLLGRTPKDFDVATSAHPRQVKRLFRNGRIIGRRFRLVHITYGEHVIEVSTFRREPPPRPEGEEDADLLTVEDNVFGTAEEDARRRDFTINALFLDPARRRIHDHVGGMQDLEAGVLRTIGDPVVRMAEDPVRILRAIKFATRLGFRIDEATWAAMEASAPDLARSARPRVLEEILRLMRGGTCLGAFRMLRACGALSVILPQIDEYLGSRDDPDPAAHDRADQLWRLLEALDADVHAGNVPTTPVAVAALFLRMIEREADPQTRTLPGKVKDLTAAAAEVLEPFALAARLSRRDCGRAKRIVMLQRRFTQTGGKRFRPLQFAASEDFPESLHLFRLRSMAWGQGWDVYEAWLERRKRVLEGPPSEAPAGERSEEGDESGDEPRRRPRRRGRRRRRSSAS